MTQTIKVRRKDMIARLASVKDDNIGIGGVVIDRSKLLQALKLQTQADAEVMTLTYGLVSWEYRRKGEYGNHWTSHQIDNEPCVQFSCNHTVMRFLNRPKQARYGQEPKIKHLNFIDYRAETITELTGVPIDTQKLIKALSFVLPCIATEETRPVLHCVLFDCGHGIIKLVAADGFRLAIDQVNARGIKQGKVLIALEDTHRLLTFFKAVKPIGKGKAKTYPQVYLSHDKETIKFATESGYIDLPKQQGTFPDYTKLIPTSGNHIMVVASEMLQAVKALGTIAKDGSGIIRLHFNKYPDKLTLTAKGNGYDDDKDAQAECQAFVDRACKIAVNQKYLIDYLRACKDNIIDLFVSHYTKPMLCHNGQDQSQLIMPMYVEWPEGK